ncbi:MAG: outer membrane lipoprotein-sorting protein [FCB group bacterium]|nr:outer membrane lipoprotein-sorting protein [FCB group bacterium]
MTKYFFSIFLMLLPAQEFTCQAVVDSMLNVMSAPASQGLINQVNKTSSGQERVFEYEYFSSAKQEDVLMRYLKPKNVKGNAFLMKNYSDDIWVYFSRTRRTRKLASHAKKQKVQGSEFSYEDFSGGETWKKDYTYSFGQSDSNELYRIVFIPAVDQDPSYTKMIIDVQKSNYYPSKIEYYNEKGDFEKTLFLEDIREIEGIPTAMKMKMVNHLDGSQSIMENITLTFQVNFPEDFFNERNMRK